MPVASADVIVTVPVGVPLIEIVASLPVNVGCPTEPAGVYAVPETFSPILTVTEPVGVPETLILFDEPVNVGGFGEIVPVGVYLILLPDTT